MPPVAAAVTAWAATIVVSEVVISALIYTAISFAISKLLSPKLKSGAAKSMEANYYNSEQRAPILFGFVRVGGMEVIPPVTSGADGRNLHRVLAVAGHEVSSFGTIMFDTTTVTQSMIAPISDTTSSGWVNSAFFSGGEAYAWVRCYGGTSTDSMDWLLNYSDPVSFDSEFRGRGIAKVYFKYRYSATLYKGIPQHTMNVSGAKVYDPRDGTQDYTLESTWKWKSNPALIAAWYCMKWGGYDPATEIDWASVIVAADVCDELVVIPYSVQKRYTCNGMLHAHTSAGEFQENLELLVEAMLGVVAYANGRWYFHAGDWSTPTVTITEDAWLSPPHVVLEGGSDKRHNRMHCWFIDPDRNWQRSECYPRYNPTYATADGGILDHEFDQPFCTNKWEAQRKAELVLRQTRNQVVISGQLGPRYQDLSLNETVMVDLSLVGWEAKTFRVVNFTLNVDGTVNVVLQEEQSTDWTDLTEAAYNIDSAASIPANVTPVPSAPTSLVISSVVAGTLQFTIGAPDHIPRETYYRILSSPYSAGFGTGSYAVLGNANALVMTLSDSYWAVTRYYWAQSMRANTPGGIYPASYGLPAFVLPPSDNTFNNDVVPDQEFSVGTPSFWTWNTASSLASFTYIPALTGGTDGGGRITVTGSYGRSTAYTLDARPHPNRVSSYGVPAPSGFTAYQAHVRWRVNSFTVLGSYHTYSGGYMYPTMWRADETNSDRYIASPGASHAQPNPAGMVYFAAASLGLMNDATFYMVFGHRDTDSFRGFDRASIQFRFNDGDTTTQVDIDRFIVRSLGGYNAPIGVPSWVSSPMALITLDERDFIAEIQARVGSVGFRVGANPTWPIGASAFCGKPQGAATSWIYTQSNSWFLTKAGTTSLVNTLALVNSAQVSVAVRRVGSWNYVVTGEGIT